MKFLTFDRNGFCLILEDDDLYFLTDIFDYAVKAIEQELDIRGSTSERKELLRLTTKLAETVAGAKSSQSFVEFKKENQALPEILTFKRFWNEFNEAERLVWWQEVTKFWKNSGLPLKIVAQRLGISQVSLDQRLIRYRKKLRAENQKVTFGRPHHKDWPMLFEKVLVEFVKNGGNMAEAARTLKISRTTVESWQTFYGRLHPEFSLRALLPAPDDSFKIVKETEIK